MNRTIGAEVPRKPRRGRLESIVTLGWSGIESSFRQILSLVFFFSTVHFIQPSDVGVFSVALAITAVFVIFIDEPIGESLVQKAQVSIEDWNTGFTVNLAIAFGLFLITTLIACVAGAFTSGTHLLWALVALSGSCVIGALGNIHKAYLSRALRFRTIATIALISQMVGGVVTLVMAILGFGYWALVANVMCPVVLATSLFWVASPWRPRLMLRRATIRSQASYAAYSVAVRSIYMLRDQSPLLIAGLLVDFTHVGYLGLALRVGRSVGQLFEDVTSRPLLSLISREQHDISGFGAVLTDVMTIVGLLALPGYVGLAVVGPGLITLIFGEKWAPAGTLLPWVCILLAGWLVLHIVAVSLRARALGRVAVMVTLPAALADAVILAVVAPFGLNWALMGCAARAVLMLPVAVRMLDVRLGVSPRRLAERWGPPLAASLVMVVGLAVLQSRYSSAGANLMGLGAIIIAGSLLYLSALVAVTVTTFGRTTMRRQLMAVMGKSG